MQTSDTGEFHLKGYVLLLWRWWWVIALTALTGVGLGHYVNISSTPLYESTTRILVQGGQTPGTPSFSDFQASQQIAQNYVELITVTSVMEAAAAELSVPHDPAQVAGKLTVRSPRSFIDITARDPDRDLAAEIANVVTTVFIDDFQRRQLTQIAQFQASLAQYGILQDTGIVAAQAAALSTLSVVEPAVPGGAPVFPLTRLNLILGLVLGIGLGALIVLVRDLLDDSVKNPGELTALSGISSFGSVPHVRQTALSGIGSPDSSSRDDPLQRSFQFIRMGLEFSSPDSPVKSILVTSCSPREGKTTIATHLAASTARDGKRVVLFDGDMRRASLHKVFDIGLQPGFSQFLAGSLDLDAVLAPTALPTLRVIPGGPLPPDPGPLLRATRLAEALRALRETTDLIIIDSPPLLAVADPLILATSVDMVLLVVSARHGGKNALRRGAELLKNANPHLVGAVFNQDSQRSAREYYTYYYAEEEPSQNGRAGKRALARLRRALPPWR